MSVYACADFHGRLDLFRQVQSFLKEDDVLYILGDVIDRGPDGWKLFKEVLKDSRCKLLMGNHEDMAWEALHYEDFYVWYYNGGNITHNQMLEDSNYESIIPLLHTLPLQAEYTNKDGIHIIMNHAGFFIGDKGIKDWRDGILWDRSQYIHHFLNCWDGPDNVIMVHGHTPIPYLLEDFRKFSEHYHIKVPKYEDGALWYADNHRVDLDMGSAWTNKIVVLDLDTFDEHIFEV